MFSLVRAAYCITTVCICRRVGNIDDFVRLKTLLSKTGKKNRWKSLLSRKNGHSLSAHVRFPRLSDVCVFVYQTISINSNRIECWLCSTISTLNPKRVDFNFQTKSNINSNKHLLLLNRTTTVVNCFSSAWLWLLTVLIEEREGKKNRHSYIV